MKKIYAIISALILSVSIFAQAPQKMSYQAVVRDAGNTLLSNSVVGIQISILRTSSTGKKAYVERHISTTNDNGLATIEIGGGTPVSGDFTKINWGNDTYFIKTEIDTKGGVNYSITGTSQLLSVPYALSSADNKWTSNGTSIYNLNLGNIGIGNATPNAPLAFAASLGKKITLYPGTTGDVGLGVSGNRLQIYADNPNADVALGYDEAGVFNERFAVKPNGALAVNGNTGGLGQILQSNGSSSAATWTGKPHVITFSQTGNADLGNTANSANIPGIDNQPFNLTENSSIAFFADLNAYSLSPLYIAYCYTEIQILNAVNQVVASARAYESLPSLRKINMNVVGAANLPVGIYTVKAVLARLDVLSGVAMSEPAGKLIIQIFPQ